MDIQTKIEEIVAKIKNDPAMVIKFKSDPVKTLETLLEVDLPEDQLNMLLEGVKAKINIDSAGDMANKIKNLF